MCVCVCEDSAGSGGSLLSGLTLILLIVSLPSLCQSRAVFSNLVGIPVESSPLA